MKLLSEECISSGKVWGQGGGNHAFFERKSSKHGLFLPNAHFMTPLRLIGNWENYWNFFLFFVFLILGHLLVKRHFRSDIGR